MAAKSLKDFQLGNQILSIEIVSNEDVTKLLIAESLAKVSNKISNQIVIKN